ncbi:MFS transporter [Oceanicaulis sp. LC35]|uniref:MFS transporter n=1 Tax=Oceanicaulis sp. LC35 TaxID=3349635 RepID=UPI003F855C38
MQASAWRNEAKAAGYATGNFAKNLLWGAADIILLFAMTDLAGIDPAIAGLILLVSLVFDAVVDPMVGALADRLRTPFGKYGVFILPGSVMASSCFVWMIQSATTPGKAVLAIALAVFAFRMTYSLIDLPHNALMSVAFSKSRQRARLAGYRFFFSSMASLLFAVWLGPVLGRQGAESAQALRSFAWLAAGLSALTMVLAWSMVRKPDRQAVRSRRQQAGSERIGDLFSNGQFQLILALGVLGGLGPPLFAKTLAYYTVYVLEASHLSTQALTAITIGQLAALPLWIIAGHRFEKARLLQAAYLLSGAAFLLASCLGPTWPSVYVLGAALGGAGLSGVYSIIWGMMPDVFDWLEHRTGARHEGMGYGVVIFLMKASNALATGAMGLALSHVAYTPGESQSPLVVGVLQGVSGIAPFIVALCAVWICTRYRITHRLQERLASGKAGREAA